jgi:hypothetical protein
MKSMAWEKIACWHASCIIHTSYQFRHRYPSGGSAMSINEFEMNEPSITMGAAVETAAESRPASSKAEQLQLQLQSLEIERQSPTNICVLEAALSDL